MLYEEIPLLGSFYFLFISGHRGETDRETHLAKVYIGQDDSVFFPATTWPDFSQTLKTVEARWTPAKLVAALLPAWEILSTSCIMQA